MPARQRSPRGALPHRRGLCGEVGLIDARLPRQSEIEPVFEPVAAALQDIGALLLQCMCATF